MEIVVHIADKKIAEFQSAVRQILENAEIGGGEKGLAEDIIDALKRVLEAGGA